MPVIAVIAPTRRAVIVVRPAHAHAALAVRATTARAVIAAARAAPGSPGSQGAGVISAAIDVNRHLLLTLTSGVVLDAGVLPGGDTSALELAVADLLQRVEALEAGGGGLPAGTLLDGSGQPLTGLSGDYLTL